MLDLAVIRRFVHSHYGVHGGCQIDVLPLCGGLETQGITRVSVKDVPGAVFVVKPLAGHAVRELRMHSAVASAMPEGPAPRVLGWELLRPGEGYLFIEWVRRTESWPWRDTRCADLVLARIAEVHNSDVSVPAAWDYESELFHSASCTANLYRDSWVAGVRPAARAMTRTLQRVTESLSGMRHQLMSWTGTALLHGDVHPGNALITETPSGARAMLLDWGRARTGSPLEDVSSWLQTLAFWEPQVRRFHDTLLVSYLRHAGWPERLSPSFREAWWLAGASNAMAGALRYHLAVIRDEERTEAERHQSWAAAADWLRILRRADECWRA
jgi:aminoglycoside phosphotransferase (APT) family kinase protein